MIRQAISKDVNELFRLEMSVFEADDFALTKRSFYYHIKRNLLLVAKKDDEILGYILVFSHLKIPRIYSLAVSKKARNLGIATLLLDNILSKFPTLRLEVKQNNQNAIKLYQKFGFKIIKKLPKYYKNEDGILMIKT